METQINYKSFNKGKTIEELQYDLLQNRTILRNLITEYEFYVLLLNAAIYKPQTVNLFERLETFKGEIERIDEANKILLNEIGMQIHQIDKKIECEDLACDDFFIKEIDELAYRTSVFLIDTADLKSRMFQYLQYVIIEN